MSCDRGAAIAWYRKNRARSRALFDLVADEAYYSQPIALRHPIVFYEGHLPAFSFNTLVKRGLGLPSIDPALETLFARGIDPAEAPPGDNGERARWPSRDEVREFVDDGGYSDSRWWNAQDWCWIQTESVTHPLFWERHDTRWYWRGMFERVSLPAAWPAYVSHAEASAFARWSGGRLPTEAEFQ